MSPETYLLLKHLHRASALLSIGGFMARWAGTMAQRRWVRSRLAMTLPHVNDTLLLGSAVTVAVGAGLNPLQTPWLATKIVLLLVYIGLGMLALSTRRTPVLRALAGGAALLVAAHIVATAVTKNPAGLLAL